MTERERTTMGRPAMSDAEKMARADRLRAFRERLRAEEADGLQWTQDAVADRAGILRIGYNKMERGKSAFSGGSIGQLAKTFGLEEHDFQALLRGDLSDDAAMARRNKSNPPALKVLKALAKFPALKKLAEAHPTRWHWNTLMRAVLETTYVREGEREPEVGWVSLLDAIESGAIDRTEESGDLAVAMHAEAVGERPAIRGFMTKKTAKKKSKPKS